jgi:hypothetical protein
VLARMSEEDRKELKKRLQRPRQLEGIEAKPRLYFDLKSAPLIPSCMIKDDKTDSIPGKMQDLWDDGVVLWRGKFSFRQLMMDCGRLLTSGTWGPNHEGSGSPVKLPYVLIAVVGLLSAEWLIRKLLRLA